ncbi:TetR/AcrR family transcriptional regulator [bacterium]|nr:TetR/AcrR family transcriptional regulator [bacterium]
MNKREKQTAQTIADIMRVSEKLFIEQGFEKTTVQQITDKCGMTKGGFYHHFESKDQVLEKMLSDHHQELMKAVQPILENNQVDFVQRVNMVIKIMRRVGQKKSSFLAEYLKIRRNEGNIILKERLKKYEKKVYLEVIAPILEDGRVRGECSFASPADVVALLIFQLDKGITEVLQEIFIEKNPEDAQVYSKALMENFVMMLAKIIGTTEEKMKEMIDYDNAILFFNEILDKRKK